MGCILTCHGSEEGKNSSREYIGHVNANAKGLRHLPRLQGNGRRGETAGIGEVIASGGLKE